MRKFVVWVLLGCLMGASLSSYADEQDEWDSAQLSMSDVELFTWLMYPCLKSAHNVSACVELINGLGEFLKPKQMLLPKGGEALYPGMQVHTLNEFGQFTLVEITDPEDLPKTPEEFFERRAAKAAARLEASSRTFADGCMDFIGLFKKMQSQLPPKISKSRAFGEAMAQMAQTLDPHAQLTPTKHQQEESAKADKEFVGIGLSISSTPKGIEAEPLEGSPAKRFGMQDGDLIEKVDGQPTRGLTLDDVGKKIRGPLGKTVLITIDRNGQKIDLTIVRGKIVTRNVDSHIVKHMDDSIQHIRIRSFNDENLCSTVRKIFTNLDRKVSGVVLDLRGNPGGLLSEAVCLGGVFVGRKPIVLVRKVTDGQTAKASSAIISSQNQMTHLPLVVLIDSQSASASEVIAGAMQDYQRAWIMGVRSFGKGTVQSGAPLPFNPTVLLFQTIERFYQPLDHTNQMVGITPDIEVFATPDPGESQKSVMREDSLFLNALPAIGTPWVQPRPEAISQISNSCLTGRAEALYASNQATKQKSDYQLYKAEEILACRPNRNITVSR